MAGRFNIPKSPYQQSRMIERLRDFLWSYIGANSVFNPYSVGMTATIVHKPITVSYECRIEWSAGVRDATTTLRNRMYFLIAIHEETIAKGWVEVIQGATSEIEATMLLMDVWQGGTPIGRMKEYEDWLANAHSMSKLPVETL